MRRKIYDSLLQWKQEKDGTTALMIEGARRVGKSYIAEEFARNEYDSYILIDFSKAPKRVKEKWHSLYADVYPEVHQEIRAVPEHAVCAAHEGRGAEGRACVPATVYDTVIIDAEPTVHFSGVLAAAYLPKNFSIQISKFKINHVSKRRQLSCKSERNAELAQALPNRSR
jgi:AAA+ ATPase superfamily predicted ATPase